MTVNDFSAPIVSSASGDLPSAATLRGPASVSFAGAPTCDYRDHPSASCCGGERMSEQMPCCATVACRLDWPLSAQEPAAPTLTSAGALIHDEPGATVVLFARAGSRSSVPAPNRQARPAVLRI